MNSNAHPLEPLVLYFAIVHAQVYTVGIMRPALHLAVLAGNKHSEAVRFYLRPKPKRVPVEREQPREVFRRDDYALESLYDAALLVVLG